MKFRIQSLSLKLRRETVRIPLADVSYFWGQMGAGKTSIARLLDFCLGGDIELTPALQREFTSAAIMLELENAVLTIERPRDSEFVVASWLDESGPYEVKVPARRAAGEILPGTGVENLSDLIFRLSNVRPPRVRKSKLKEDSDTARLSIRDLLWYCYIDQDHIDSSFFHLEEKAPFYLKHKSRDVLRFIVGFHDERVADLEAQLDNLKGERQGIEASIRGFGRVLREIGVESEAQINERIESLSARSDQLGAKVLEIRASGAEMVTHAADELRSRALEMSQEIALLDDAMRSIEEVVDRDRRHLNEIEMLALKFKRSISAKAVLVGVEFDSCPRCMKRLPERQPDCCHVCAQDDAIETIDPTEISVIEKDAKGRIAELESMVSEHLLALTEMRQKRDRLAQEKARTERERNDVMSKFDSAYLSLMLNVEREQASVIRESESLQELTRLPRMVDAQKEQLMNVLEAERETRRALSEARTAAQSDLTNIESLKRYFLDCLVRSGIHGITAHDVVELDPTDFFPKLTAHSAPGAITDFVTISSGGKKTLFKSCFAIAVHRLANEIGASLPELLIVDSPMKNISERENVDQFKGFYRMIYDLAAGELRGTQFILIDKEFSAPGAGSSGFTLIERHMRPGSEEFPPLIPYYDGK